MIRKRLFELVPGAPWHVFLTVALRWLGLVSNIAFVWVVCSTLTLALEGALDVGGMRRALVVGLVVLALKAISTKLASRESFAAAVDVKRVLRHRIYEKLLRLGPSYSKRVPTAEVVQLSVEGCEQLETYFGQYLPQLFSAILAPITLFVALFLMAPAAWPAALVLLVFVPLIPLVIVLVRRTAKGVLSSYWDEYTSLGDSFLESLQGLTTLKIYQADKARHEVMDEEAERFRAATMRVLRTQLNSIVFMDVGAFGGAAAGMGMALWLLSVGSIDFTEALLVALLSVDFFRPLRRLGSYFHVAMSGMAASDRIFNLLDLEEPTEGGTQVPAQGDHLLMSHLSFSWDGGREVLHDVSVDIPSVGLTAIVGESGSGKSTIAALLAGRAEGYGGKLLLGGRPLAHFDRRALARYVTTVPAASYLFAGTVKDNLLMGHPRASEEDMWSVLEGVDLAAFLRAQDGLDTRIEKRGENLSGGQRQRLALARAFLHNSPVYILDEATSNIDVESEKAIMTAVRGIARYKAVILISHRLANVTAARRIYVLEHGRVVGEGDHARLLLENTTYRRLWEGQQALEAFEPTTLDAPFDDEIEDDEQVSEGVDAAEEGGMGGTADTGGAGDASSDAPSGTGDADALSDTDDAGTEPVAKDAADETPTAEVSAAPTETEVVDMPEPAEADAKDVPVTSIADSNAREADDAKPE
ncbi:ATP-binding cassette domain-containing protein [Olsenella sp. oral taxon 807]|uniref:ATP-binding cassette domain-containing protein n=1 Tax=Olsenella sp. oral taxon 807 TaxID=712411 RepID=UPI0009FA5C63|nr:ATP-binding cassette domain-containing protein [Olsenella sp. oral taxon 807]